MLRDFTVSPEPKPLTNSERGYPMISFPRGWYQLAWSDEIQKGYLYSKTCFDSDVLILRNESGDVKVFDAFCPHLGAHLLKSNLAARKSGGLRNFGKSRLKLKSEEIVCPFHSWQFNLDGECKKTSNEKIPTKKMGLKNYPVKEFLGLIFVYLDTERKVPDFELPSFPEIDLKEWTPLLRSVDYFRGHVQEVVENAVDRNHLGPIHGFDVTECTSQLNEHNFSTHTESTKKILGFKCAADLQFYYTGMGFAIGKFTKPFEMLSFVSTLPISDTHIEHRVSIMFKMSSHFIFRIGLIRPLLLRLLHRQAKLDFLPDMLVWENKKYHQTPMLMKDENMILQMRKWCKKYYPDVAQENAQPIRNHLFSASSLPVVMQMPCK